MSLNQLTANYTDSEGEDENPKNISISSDDYHISESKDAAKETPNSMESRESSGNTPKKAVNRLVSYANEDDDDDDHTFYKNNEDHEDSDEILNSEPMDTETEDGEEEKSSDFKDLGVKLPSAPAGKCSAQLQDKVTHFINRIKDGNMDWNRKIQNTKDFRNPSIYEKLIDHLGLDEMGSNYPLEMFDPHCWGKESYYDEISRVQKEEMDRREKERKEKTKVDIISGTKKPPEEEAKKRKSRFDQAAPGNPVAVIKNSVPPPTLTSVPSGNKTTISAFGSLKKAKI
ncbi:SAP30-binding protein [Armadillidium nasatum]|uniref:SAP30-binding protein n=1 Tax=Armadillidium nasatum TaxID=96803 RepID=A0A5N5TMB7_9CRUS|nr:SAP30-binding protein [Armadillidium nasatum]